MAERDTLWTYLREWLRAASKVAWDVFGGVGLAIGALLWAWHKYAPVSFTAAAASLRLSQEDLVWEIPLAFGGVVFVVRFVRAPFEMHVAAQDDHQAETDRLRTIIEGLQSRTDRFDINIDTAGYYVAVNTKPDYPRTQTEMWLIYEGVVITNRTDQHVPLEVWLNVGMHTDDSWRIGEVCGSPLPDWINRKRLEGAKQFDRVLNLAPRAAASGFCAAELEPDSLRWAGVADVKELVETRPFWLEVKNTLTNESVTHAVNYIARNTDRGVRE
jgi:hypothetical protein